MILKNPDGTETYYEAIGSNDAHTLVLLHGIGADHAMWQPQLQNYSNEGYRLLALDLFGHGRSSNLSHISLTDWHNQINWLLDDQGIEKCTLIGASMGGVIAQSFVAHDFSRVERVVITDSFGELKTLQEKLLGFSAVLGFSLFKILGTGMLAKGMHSTYKAAYAQQAQDYFMQVSSTIDLDQMILARKAINQVNVLDRLQTVSIPALVIVGAGFGQAFIEINQKIADALPNSQFVILDQSMDPSNLVNPVEFDKHVLRFLKEKGTS
ncbi:alpha/beta fold hydrolase [Vacuolonema iberomarrocanum]|uniref:alpha/beta fold hydrolase n=1 Tax=Vacuolonema iberomarrocanum TaxID=3454632 RepID=UPI001A0EDF3B|nr:alpha/beta hydrolase [filamentous cyanobacterium LEGE 07170]